LLAPVAVGVVAWIVGLLFFDALGAGYIRSLLARLLG
jgi:hypothetical protein